ncbi:TetR/AcrR family transcriptional regulator [Providencia sneebia]|uniref:TetR family transcriptional regulator n=1 Tax=Providencia sneebia DSM 19967 TaxID=1141660 RepID=K8WME9_9GAMM|nr:TetR/AcrR family transcriptional regulator [Providencia sneebia]EKT57325.1 TetR family transcriptional regulator [Providencia sneebia DSM 19967]
MNAAESLFLTQGFLETTVSEIVKDADVAKGTFYHYFTSKDEILEALRERYMTWYLACIDQAIDGETDSQEILLQWCESSIKCYVEKMRVHDMLFHEGFHKCSNIHEERAIAQVKAILLYGQERKAWSATPINLVSSMMYHCMHTAVDNLTNSAEYNEKTLGLLLYQRLLGLIK